MIPPLTIYIFLIKYRQQKLIEGIEMEKVKSILILIVVVFLGYLAIMYVVLPVTVSAACSAIGSNGTGICGIPDRMWSSGQPGPAPHHRFVFRPEGQYVPGAPRNPAECIARGGTNTGRGCRGFH